MECKSEKRPPPQDYRAPLWARGLLPGPPESATITRMTYPGGKHGPGVWHRLINEIPPHHTYISGFAGHDAIAREKRPAARTVLIDLDPEPLAWWAEYLAARGSDQAGGFELHHANALQWLHFYFGLSEVHKPASRYRDAKKRDDGHFVFLDPPYLMTTRSSGPLYNCEMTDADHADLLELATRLPCNVMICGYHSDYTPAHSRDGDTSPTKASAGLERKEQSTAG